MRRALVCFLVASLVSCDDGTGQITVEKELYVRGTEEPPEFAFPNANVRVESFEVAFGPVYLCGGTSAGDLCQTARAEWLSSRRVELIGAGSTPLGVLSGLSGPVRSYMFDLGRVSYRTREEIVALPAARELGSSVRVHGEVMSGSVRIPLTIALNVDANPATGKGLPVVSSELGIPVIDLQQDDAKVEFHFDVARSLEASLEPYFSENQACSRARRETCHEGNWEVCDSAGVVTRTEDCLTRASVCVANLGCQSALSFDSSEPLAQALRDELVAGTRPTLSLVK